MITFYPIIGISIGFELTQGEQNGEQINYFLIDLLVFRLQFAWYV